MSIIYYIPFCYLQVVLFVFIGTLEHFLHFFIISIAHIHSYPYGASKCQIKRLKIISSLKFMFINAIFICTSLCFEWAYCDSPTHATNHFIFLVFLLIVSLFHLVIFMFHLFAVRSLSTVFCYVIIWNSVFLGRMNTVFLSISLHPSS